MKQPAVVLDSGTEVVTHATLESTRGYSIKQKHLDARRTNARGVIGGWVPGHGGDVYWVKHADGQVAAYGFTEFELYEDTAIGVLERGARG